MRPAGGIPEPMRATIRLESVDVSIFDSPANMNGGQDDWLVEEWDDLLRFAVIDGASPASGANLALMDEGKIAAALVRNSLRSTDSMETLLLSANKALIKLNPLQIRPQAAIAAIEPFGSGMRATRYGDCNVWYRLGKEWFQCFDDEKLTPKAVAEMSEWMSLNSGCSHDELVAAENKILGFPEAWITAPLGRFENPLGQEEIIENWDEIVLATDGALLSLDALSDLSGWLENLRHVESEMKGSRWKSQDDATVLWGCVVDRASVDSRSR